MRLHVLGSGSKGNASIIENPVTGEGVLIDCGICKRDFMQFSNEAGFDVTKLKAIFVTHEHTDHTKGMGVVLRGLAKLGVHPELHVAEEVLASSKDLRAVGDLVDVVHFRAGDAITAAGLLVHPFATSHDAAGSFGFRLEGPDSDALGFMTDTGIVTPAAHEALVGVRILALEANHDAKMLKEGPYPYVIKRRIASDQGHLENGQAAEELRSLLHGGLEQVVAMHISENNNTYGIPVRALEAVLAQEGHGAQVRAAYQKRLVSVS